MAAEPANNPLEAQVPSVSSLTVTTRGNSRSKVGLRKTVMTTLARRATGQAGLREAAVTTLARRAPVHGTSLVANRVRRIWLTAQGPTNAR